MLSASTRSAAPHRGVVRAARSAERASGQASWARPSTRGRRMPELNSASPRHRSAPGCGLPPVAAYDEMCRRRRRAAPALGVPDPRARRARRRRARAPLARGAAPAARERRHLQRLRRPAARRAPVAARPDSGCCSPAHEWSASSRASSSAPSCSSSCSPISTARRRWSRAACCRPSWSTPTPASCARASASSRPAAATCRSTPPTWRARRTGSSASSAIAPRRRPAPATRSRTASCCRASCPASTATRTCTGWRCSSARLRATLHGLGAAAAATTRASCCSRRARATRPTSSTPSWPSYLGYTLVAGRRSHRARRARVAAHARRPAAGRRHPAPRRRRLLRSARAARRLAARRARPAAGGARRARRDRQSARQQRRREPRPDAVPAGAGARAARRGSRAAVGADLVVRRADAARLRARAPRAAGGQADRSARQPLHRVRRRRSTTPERAALRARSAARPHALRRRRSSVALSTAPVLGDGRLEPRAIVLRAFLVADARRLRRHARRAGRVAPDAPTRWMVSNQHGGVSKDVWVLSSEPEREVGLLVPADRPLPLSAAARTCRAASPTISSGSAATPSAPKAARAAARGCCAVLDLDAAPHDAHLPLLLRAVTASTGTLPRLRRRRRRGAPRGAGAELLRVLFDRGRTGSLRFNLEALVRAARAVRDRLSTDTWRVISALDRELAGRATLDAALERLERLLLLLAAFGGLSADSMSRGQRWRFLEIGRRLERGSAPSPCCAASVRRRLDGAACRGRRCSRSPTRRSPIGAAIARTVRRRRGARSAARRREQPALARLPAPAARRAARRPGSGERARAARAERAGVR